MNSDDFSDAALVVLGHGTTLNSESARPVRQHCATLRRRHLFARVCQAYWKQEPHVRRVLRKLACLDVLTAATPVFTVVRR